MRKIINGARYDTDAARIVGTGGNGLSRSDFSYYHETMYRTKSGKYFLHGEGGPMTRYSRRVDGNSWAGGEKIIPLTIDEAREWMERNMDSDAYANEFGEPDEASEVKTTMNISIDPALKSKLERMRAETGKSISQLIAEKFLD